MLLYPDYMFSRVWKIPAAWFSEHGISVLLLDVDNTLTTHNNPEVPRKVTKWIECMQKSGMKLLILSNNKPGRVEPFAQKLGVGYIANAKKPLSSGVRRACEILGAPPESLAVIGDQIFTDVLCANLSGVTSVLVEPMELETFWGFKIKRALERPILKRYRKK